MFDDQFVAREINDAPSDLFFLEPAPEQPFEL